MTPHTIELPDPFNAADPLIILLQLSSDTSYFDVCSLSIVEYENKDIPKIHLTAEEPPQDQSTNEYSERDSNIRSLRSDQYPCHNSKGTSICQCNYLILTVL